MRIRQLVGTDDAHERMNLVREMSCPQSAGCAKADPTQRDSFLPTFMCSLASSNPYEVSYAKDNMLD